MILGGVNFGSTFLGLYFIERFGRRKCLFWGALCMGVCFIIFASVGAFVLDNTTPQNTPQAGAAMIVFACLFIVAYASTWGPMIWTVVGELYPNRFRAFGMSLATTSNWGMNFLLAFFTPFITAKIGFKFGYVFAACNFFSAVVVYLFVMETKGRSLEQIDTMYIAHVPPRKSGKWEPEYLDDETTGERVSADDSKLSNGEHVENVGRT
jgi:SP family sugar:H+ symporter-like MFS transporter